MYIRTKNKIYQVESTLRDNGFVKGYNVGYMAFITKDQVINQSENLEELCDMFVDEETKTIFHKHNGYVINWKTNMVYSLKALSESYHSIKGAIYTDKGLIYVAKMNENGDLELI